jgi:hypothetical protein
MQNCFMGHKEVNVESNAEKTNREYMRYEVLTAVKVEIIVFCCGVPYSVEDEVPNCRKKRLILVVARRCGSVNQIYGFA